jgi:outer membrane protein
MPAQWHLQDCIAYAKKNNISLASLRLSINLAKEDLLLSKASLLPNLVGSVSQGVFNSHASQIVGTTQINGHFSGNYGLNSSVVLYNGNYLRNDILSKDYAYQSANLSLQETENNLSLSIAQAFFNVMMSKETMISLDTVLATSNRQFELGKERFDAGSISKKEFLLFDAQVATDQFNLINATNEFKLNTVILKQYLLLPTSYIFITADAPIDDAYNIISPLVDAQELARKNRPEIQNRLLLIKKSEVELDKSKANRKPIINAGAALSSSYTDNSGDVIYHQIGNNFYQSLSVTMGIPIYNRRINRTNINKSKILLQQSELDFINTRTILDQQIEQAFINLLNANAQFTAARIQLNTTKEIYRISNEQLAMGGLNSIDLFLQKNLYVQALQLFTQAKYRTILYRKIYSFYINIPLAF